MKNRKLLLLLLCFILALSFAGCSFKKSKSHTFKLTTGDTVKVTFDTTKGYDVESSSNTIIFYNSDNKKVTFGAFGSKADYDTFYNNLSYDPKASIIDKGSNKNIEYVFYKTEGSSGVEYDHIIYIKGSNTCFIMGNMESMSSAEDIFNRLEFNLE